MKCCNRTQTYQHHEGRGQDIYHFRRVSAVIVFTSGSHAHVYFLSRTSGLGRGAAKLLTSGGAYVALFDLADDGNVASQLPAGLAKFFQVDVTSTSDILNAIDGTIEWTRATGAPLGGVIACAGIAAPAKVCRERFSLPSGWYKMDTTYSHRTN